MDNYTAQFLQKLQEDIENGTGDSNALMLHQLHYTIVMLSSLQSTLNYNNEAKILVDEVLEALPKSLIEEAVNEYPVKS